MILNKGAFKKLGKRYHVAPEAFEYAYKVSQKGKEVVVNATLQRLKIPLNAGQLKQFAMIYLYSRPMAYRYLDNIDSYNICKRPIVEKKKALGRKISYAIPSRLLSKTSS
jgi:hypothetical protein